MEPLNAVELLKKNGLYALWAESHSAIHIYDGTVVETGLGTYPILDTSGVKNRLEIWAINNCWVGYRAIIPKSIIIRASTELKDVVDAVIAFCELSATMGDDSDSIIRTLFELQSQNLVAQVHDDRWIIVSKCHADYLYRDDPHERIFQMMTNESKFADNQYLAAMRLEGGQWIVNYADPGQPVSTSNLSDAVNIILRYCQKQQ